MHTDNQEEKIPKNPNEPHKPEPKKNHKPWIPAIVGGLIGASLVGTVGAVVDHNDGDSVSQEQVEKIVQERVQEEADKHKDGNKQQASLDVSTDVTETTAKTQDAVVSVANLANKKSTIDLFGFVQPDQKASDGNSSEDDYETASEGSGVVYKKDGQYAYIVTNNHVIDGSDALEVLLNNGDQVKAELVGTDVWTDLAVLRIPASAVDTVAEFGDSDSLKVGEQAIAIGSPLGSEFASTVTQGIISGLNRNVPVDLDGDKTMDWQVNAIQTDAAINPGNSGGALLNSAGQVIGINSMKISSGQVEGMGFAIPSNDVKTIIDQLEAKGHVERPQLGVAMANLNQIPIEQQDEVLKAPDNLENGVVVVDIDSDSPAAKSDLKVNDIITSFNGHEVTDNVSLRKALYDAKPNERVNVEVYRNGKKQTVTIQLEPQSENP